MIYNNNLNNSIKIKHIINNDSFKKEICIFGVLCNDNGLQIEKLMLDWLIPEYDVYCVYQKYPGEFYEYPALRFAQWFSQKYNKTIILYVHTKGAFHASQIQKEIKKVWRFEFTKKRKYIYIQLLKNNQADVSTPYTDGNYTWYNGMFISNRAFNLIGEIKYNPQNRWYYESLFSSSNKSSYRIRIKGVLNNSISSYDVCNEVGKYAKKNKRICIFVIILTFLIFSYYLKIINNF